MRKFYFTFGSGSPLANTFVCIEAADEMVARLQMNCWFTSHWASCYPEDRWGDQATRYGLTELRVPRSASVRLMTNREDIDPAIMDAVYHSGRVAMHAR